MDRQDVRYITNFLQNKEIKSAYHINVPGDTDKDESEGFMIDFTDGSRLTVKSYGSHENCHGLHMIYRDSREKMANSEMWESPD